MEQVVLLRRSQLDLLDYIEEAAVIALYKLEENWGKKYFIHQNLATKLGSRFYFLVF